MSYDILEAIDKIALVVDKELNIVYANNKSHMFFNFEVDSINLNKLFENNLNLIKSCNVVMQNNNPILLSEYNFVNLNNIITQIDIYIAKYQDKLIISMNENLLNKRGTVANKNLFAMIAHEIKNPLSAISGASQLLEKNNKNKLTDLIINETNRIAKLVNELEDITQLNNVNFSAVNIHEVLDKVELLSNLDENNITIEKQYDPSLPSVWGEEDKLIQIFLNLVKNAREVDSVSKIIIKTYYLSGVKININDKAYKALCVDIIDNGSGIAQEYHSKIFMPHQSSKKDGKGLGLAIVSMLVLAHYGKITFSTSNKGTVFSVILPLEA